MIQFYPHIAVYVPLLHFKFNALDQCLRQAVYVCDLKKTFAKINSLKHF